MEGKSKMMRIKTLDESFVCSIPERKNTLYISILETKKYVKKSNVISSVNEILLLQNRWFYTVLYFLEKSPHSY